MVLLSTFLVGLKCSDDSDGDENPDVTTGGSASGGNAGQGGKATGAVSSGGNIDPGGAGTPGNAGDGGADSTDNGEAGGAGLSGNDAAGGAAGESSTGGGSGSAGTAGASGGSAVEVLVPYPTIYGLSAPSSIMVDDEYVYWTSAWVGADPPTPLPTPSGSYLLRVPKDGGEPTVLFDGSKVVDGVERKLSLGANFAMDATSLYVPTYLDIIDSLIWKVAKDGSSAVELAQVRHLDPKRHLLIVDGTLYFEAGNGGIVSVSVNGGPVVPVIDSEATPFAEGFTYFPVISDLASDGTNLYYSGNDDGMFKVPIGGGQPELLIPRNMDGARFSQWSSWPALADGFLYWNYYGYIYKVSVEGGEPETVVEPTDLEKSGSGPQTVIDGDYIYYNAYGFQKAALDGSTRVRLLDPALNYNATEFTIDETHVYMWASGNQSIIKLPK